MTKFKRFAAIAAVSMLGIQLMGAGTAFANATVDGECDFGSDSLEITLGENSGNGNGDKGDVSIWIDENGDLYCDPDSGATDDDAPASTIDSITVEMDDEDTSDGNLVILLDDTEGSAAEWPDFDTFDIDVTTAVVVDGSGVTDGASGTSAANKLRITVGATSLSFNGTTATSNAPAYDITGSENNDSIDASKATVKIIADGNDGDDTIKGGSKNDDLDGGDDEDVVYGNGGNDVLTGDGVSDDQCWAGEGNDDILACLIAAPGAGDDYIEDDATTVVYADLTKGMKWAFGVTGGAAGDDEFEDVTTVANLLGGSGDDVIAIDGYVEAGAGNDIVKSTDTVYGQAGNDLIIALDFDNGKSTGTDTSGNSNYFFGNGGDDVLKSKGGDDELRGGPGKDQAWGGAGNEDYCVAEVTNRCEVGKV